jgi:thiol-disulfide isomerase/thioredoxin
MRIKKSTLIGIILVIIIIIFLWNSLLVPKPPAGNYQPVDGSTFYSTGDQVCADNNGKPYVFMFSATFCSHCTWIKDTFKSLQGEFPEEINLQIWELDTGDNPLTFPVEERVPTEFRNIYDTYNSQGSVPTFVFGCEYMRIGNGYEAQNNLQAEAEDFKFIISKLL